MISKEVKKERRVLTVGETELFLAMEALKKQRVRRQEILLKNAQTAQDEYRRNTRNLRQ